MSRDAYLVGALVLGSRQGVEYEEDASEADAEAARVAVARATMTSAANADGGRTVDGGGPPLALSPPHQPTQTPKILPSAIDGISDEAWTAFVLAMRTASTGAVSASNALGMFEMRPRRLADLGLIDNLTHARAATGRMVWTGEWKKPLSQKIFLESPALQYRAFCASVERYIDGLRDGEIKQPQDGVDDDMTLSGALAVLHRCGPKGLLTWDNEAARFPETVDLYSKVNGIF